MKIVVLSGSPKGDDSVTLQSACYLATRLPALELSVVHVGPSIRALEKNRARFAAVVDQIRAADVVLWCTPVYHLLVPAQLKRFIELVHEYGVGDAFRGKVGAALVTSIHFCDHTAVNYLRAVSEDLGMPWFDGFPAHMNDLTVEAERARLVAFGEALVEAVATSRVLPRGFAPLPPAAPPCVDASPTLRAAFGDRRVTIVADRLVPGSSLDALVRRFVAACDGSAVTVVELAAVDVKGGCLGCCNCGFDNECSWDGKDGFREFYEQKVKPADVLVFAGAMVDRALSATWKTTFDRSFYNTHIPTYRGKQMAWIVAGPLSANANLRQVMEVYPDFMSANLAGIVSDEGAPAEVGAALDGLAVRLAGDLARAYVKPQTFLGYAGFKVLRDDVFAPLRFLFRADHRWFKQHGVYDTFPHRQRLARLGSALLGPALSIPRVKREVKGQIKTRMVERHKAIVAEARQRVQSSNA